jgi:branched-subunit amino acid aminotransferase/4-amino-4-deoxychorismate lyase
LLGDGVFETLRSYNGQLPFWNLHLERLKNGMSKLGFHLASVPFEQIKDMARELIAKNNLSDAYVRLTVSRGDIVTDFLPKWDYGKSNWVLFTKQLPSRLKINQQDGIKTIVSSIRKNSFSPIARLKTANYLDLILAKREAILRDAQEAILLDEKGHIAEASTSNLFWIKQDVLYTPSLDLPILPGITRKKILDISRDLGIPYEEGVYTPEKLLESEEAFITNSISEVVPLINVNGRKIGNGMPGSVTLRFQKEYKKTICRI